MMSVLLKHLVMKTLRKIVFGTCAIWVAKLLATGVVTEGDINHWVEIAAALLIMIGTALWTTIQNSLEGKKADKEESSTK